MFEDVSKNTLMSKPKIKIGVVSDVVCPWCYIGKRRLEKAIDKLSHKFDFEVEYFPFELNPQMPSSGMDQREYLTQKFGSSARYEQLTANVTRVASLEGIKFDYSIQETSPNTRNAHRLIQVAKEHGDHLLLIELLFKAYFTDGIDLSKNENLVKLAEEAGLDKTAVEQFLTSTTGISEIELAEQHLHELGITGVPFYIIDNKFGISGAQPVETFIQALDEIGSAPLPDGTVCDIDEQNC